MGALIAKSDEDRLGVDLTHVVQTTDFSDRPMLNLAMGVPPSDTDPNLYLHCQRNAERQRGMSI